MNVNYETDGVRELTVSELHQVAGGSDMAAAASVFAIGAALTGSLALVPGPHVFPAVAISAAFAATSAFFGLLASQK